MTNHHSIDVLLGIDSASALHKKPKERMTLIYDAPDSKEAVRSLSTVEFYDLYHDVGPSDGAILLEYASPEQVQTCLDLDIWRGDEMSDEAMQSWTEQLLAVPNEQFAELWNDLDPEIMALYLHRNIHLYVAEDKNDEVEIPEEQSANVAQTPDFCYWVAYPEDADKAENLRQLVERLYAVFGVEKAWSTLEGMNWEMATDLEETAYRFRTERIRELGFVPREEAAMLFSRVDVQKESAAIRANTQAELYVEPYPTGEKLNASLAVLEQYDSESLYFLKILSKVTNIESIKIQLLSMAQQVSIYDGFQPHETDGFEASMLLAVSYVNLGLEYASEHQDEVAERILSHIALRRLFSLGWSVTMELNRKAKLLVVRGHLSIIEDQKMSLLTNEQRDCVEGMLCSRPRPRYSALTPFMKLEDIRMAASVIADIATRELFFGEGLHKTRDDISRLAYSNDIVIGVENVSFDNIAITYMCRKAMKCEEAWGVLSLEEMPSRDFLIDSVSFERMRGLFCSDLPDMSVAAIRRYSSQLQDWIRETWPEEAKKTDPKFLVCLLVLEDE